MVYFSYARNKECLRGEVPLSSRLTGFRFYLTRGQLTALDFNSRVDKYDALIISHHNDAS